MTILRQKRKITEAGRARLKKEEDRKKRENMSLVPITNIKLSKHYSNPGLLYSGFISLISVSIEKGYSSIKRIIEYTFIEKGGTHKTNTFTKTLENDDILKEIGTYKLYELKNNYYTDGIPFRYSYWELNYNSKFKIAGTKDQKPIEVSKIEKLLNFSEIIDVITKKVKEDTKE